MKIRTKLFYPIESGSFFLEGVSMDRTRDYGVWVPIVPKYRCVLDEMVEYTNECMIEEAFSLFDFSASDGEYANWHAGCIKNENQAAIVNSYRGKIRSCQVGDIFAMQHPITKSWRIDRTFGWGWNTFSPNQIEEIFSDGDDLKEMISMTYADDFSIMTHLEKVQLLEVFDGVRLKRLETPSPWVHKNEAHLLLEGFVQ